ncbi:MAG: peptidase U32 family protein [Oscillospiraceae bacterium]
MKNIEILAPVGDYESVKAAVLNGADAIYLGATDFSARKNANNFSKDELIQAVSYCHARNVKVHLAVNTVIFDFEIPLLKDVIKAATTANVDAIIIQDLGVIDIVKALAPSMQIHASTQMAVHTVAGAKLLASMGINRVVLARELSLNEIKEIIDSVKIETEIFVHGALCMSVSGQCYISGMIGGRSGNRGNCAGTCRLESKIIDANMPATPQKNTDEHALSLKDNCLIGDIDKLIEIGVTSLKIEGRMKRPEYVASAVKTIKQACSHEDYLDEMENLESIFSRSGFTNGYLDGKMTDMFGYRRYEDVISATNKF